jgi:hypothetical protein
MTDITDDVIEDAKAAGAHGFWKNANLRHATGITFTDESLTKFAELQRQRERQAVPVPDGYFYEEISGSKGSFLGQIHDNTKWHVEHNDLKLTPFWLSAAPSVNTVKPNCVGFYNKRTGELKAVVTSDDGSLDDWVDVYPAPDCPQPIVEEPTNE